MTGDNINRTGSELKHRGDSDEEENREQTSLDDASDSINYFWIGTEPVNGIDSLEGASGYSLFDRTIGFIEDILIDENFLKLQNEILEKYWNEFDDTEENKFCYTTIFDEYVTKVEHYIENKLKEENPTFDMSELFEQLKERKGELEGEVFDMLYTLSDFMAFKEMVLNYKSFKEGKLPDITEFMTVTPVLMEYKI